MSDFEAMPVGTAAELRRLHTENAALRAALAEPVQEPVAWMVYTPDGKSVCVTDNPADFTDQHKALPLYTAPPQRSYEREIEIEVETEREACAKVCDLMARRTQDIRRAALEMAAENIRARSKE